MFTDIIVMVFGKSESFDLLLQIDVLDYDPPTYCLKVTQKGINKTFSYLLSFVGHLRPKLHIVAASSTSVVT